MLRVYDGAQRLVVHLEGPWLHPVLWLFSEEGASACRLLAREPGAYVFDSVVGTAALGCYRLIGVSRVEAGLSDSNAAALARAWSMELSVRRYVEAIKCSAEVDVASLAAKNGGLPDPEAVLSMLQRRAQARPAAVTAAWNEPAFAQPDGAG